MTLSQIDKSVWANMLRLARLCYSDKGMVCLEAAPVVLCLNAEVGDDSVSRSIRIPIDVEVTPLEQGWWSLEFGATHLHCYSRLPCPPGWEGLPNSDTPAWWVSPTGSLTPAWNIWAIVRGLYLFDEQKQSTVRDAHGRFPIEASPRFIAGLTHVPFINDILALIMDAALYFKDDNHLILSGISEIVLPPAVVLSHDLDNLTGNSFWTQVGRLARFVRAILRVELSAFSQLHFIVQNLLFPKRYYFDDQIAMWCQQQRYGFASISYILNGAGGRLGARTPFHLSKSLVDQAPPEMEIGIHYNYGALDRPGGLVDQKAQIDSILPKPCTSGRAHYLKFDPEVDFPKLIDSGVTVDESVGWPYQNSYYCGIAGPFNPICAKTGEFLEILELPMMFMDHDLPREDETPNCFSKMLHHITQVGGCLSILVHPGASNNPERPDMEMVYERTLANLSTQNARSITPQKLA